jgi:hypothetical protein
MTGRARRLIGATVGVATVIGVAMIQLGMEPRLVLVGFVVVVVLASTLLIADLAVVAAPLHWHNYGDGVDVTARPDRRVQVITARLRQPARRRRPVAATEVDRDNPHDEIGDTLVAVLDDQLRAEHGIDRSIEAAAAAEVLGPELTRFVTELSTRRSMTQRRTLAATIATIERFVSSTDSP